MDADDLGNSTTSWRAGGALSPTEVGALLALATNGPLPFADFAAAIHTTAPATARVQHGLLSRGLVIGVRAAASPNVTVLVLSTAGRVLVADLCRRRGAAVADKAITVDSDEHYL